MRIFLSPQVTFRENFKYSFEGEKLIVTLGELKDEFDFTGLPDGILEMYDGEGNELIKTIFEFNPILSAEKKEGVLYLDLRNRISDNATEDERFPKWIDAEDYVFKENENFKEVDNGETELEITERNR